jgi:hypothetical protein
MTRIEDQGQEDQNLVDHTLELGARSENDQACVDQDKKMSKEKDKGESMSMMRNFDNEDHTPSVPRQDHKMSQGSPTPVVPSQDKKIPSTPKYDQEPASVIPDFVKGKKMNVGSDPVGDETYRQAKAIAWELVGRTNETREKLLNEIMKLHTGMGLALTC